eukprot:3245361-Rhodomonas_salina.1
MTRSDSDPDSVTWTRHGPGLRRGRTPPASLMRLGLGCGPGGGGGTGELEGHCHGPGRCQWPGPRHSHAGYRHGDPGRDPGPVTVTLPGRGPPAGGPPACVIAPLRLPGHVTELES